MCGEHTMRNFPYLRDKGSSPHVRGAPSEASKALTRLGIIPACAGSTKPPAQPEA